MEILLCTVQCYNSNKLFNAEVNVSMSNDIIKILMKALKCKPSAYIFLHVHLSLFRTYVRTGVYGKSSTRDVENGVVYRKLKKTELKRKVACCLLHSLSRSVEYLVSLLN